MISRLEEMDYHDWLRILNLPTLEQRRNMGEYIHVYKCIRNIDKVDDKHFIERDTGERTREHSYKLKLSRGSSDLKSKRFPNNSVIGWNKMPVKAV